MELLEPHWLVRHLCCHRVKSIGHIVTAEGAGFASGTADRSSLAMIAVESGRAGRSPPDGDIR